MSIVSARSNTNLRKAFTSRDSWGFLKPYTVSFCSILTLRRAFSSDLHASSECSEIYVSKQQLFTYIKLHKKMQSFFYLIAEAFIAICIAKITILGYRAIVNSVKSCVRHFDLNCGPPSVIRSPTGSGG